MQQGSLRPSVDETSQQAARRPSERTPRSPPAAELPAMALWTMARAASDDGRWATGLRLAERALRRVDRDGEPDPILRARILVALAYNNSELGHTERARELLDEAAACEEILPAVRVARGLILVRTGHPDAALADLDAAVQQLRAAGSTEGLEDLAGALINRGLLHIVAGRLAPAAADTEEAGSIARELHRGDILFMAQHNLGFVRYLAGDLPAALSAMEAAAAAWPGAAQDGVSLLDRSRVLAAAGLIDAAGEHIDRALEILRVNRATADLLDAYLVRAELDLLAGQPLAATRAAQRAERIARRRGNGPAALSARTMQLQATRAHRLDIRRADPFRRPGSGQIRRARRDAADASLLAAELDGAGLVEEARVALLLEAEFLLEAGDVTAAADLARALHRRSGGVRLATRLHGRLVDGQLALAAGRRQTGLALVGRGLDELSRFQAEFGSQDLQTAASVHGRELTQLGLRTAVQSGSPAAILHWLERARGVTTRLPAVRPPADPQFARELGAFRAGDQQVRQAVLSGRRDPALEEIVRDRRRRVQTLAWSESGSGDVRRPLTLTAVQRQLAAGGSRAGVIAYIVGGDVLHALVISAGRATFRKLGPIQELRAAIRRISADLDLLAAPRIPGAVRTVAQHSLAAGLDHIWSATLEPIEHLVDSGPVLIAGVGMLTTVPWNLLPGLRGRAVSVTASVTAALPGRRGRELPLGQVLTVAGPDLPNGAAEAEQIAALYLGSTSLIGDAATGAQVLDRIQHGGLLHIAAHGHHEVESPLFSWVQLADGPLYGYDIAPNPALPDHVVLSSCDVGRSDHLRPGGEPLGLAAALLRSGVSTVIAGVSRISDVVAAETMISYHRRLLAGDGPAVALAAAIGGTGGAAGTDGAPVPLVCFGVGG